MSILVAAIQAADLVTTLKGSGPFTVFAPNNDAFAKLPIGVVEDLTSAVNKVSLARILKYHVADGNYTTEDIESMALPSSLTMVDGGSAILSKDGTDLKINNGKIITPNVFATNGVIHVIDSVILPALDVFDTALVSGTFRTLIKALNAADLAATLKTAGPFTVLAPNNEAFQKLPPGTLNDLLKPENKDRLANILKFHVISQNLTAAQILALDLPKQVETLANLSPIVDKTGTTVTINGVNVIQADVFGSNGIIHVVDTVILPPTNIPQTATNTADLQTLVTALGAADLVDTLSVAGPFTVFAPDDTAFGKLPAGVVEDLIKPENKPSLSKILQYHVTGGLVTSSSINRMQLPANINMLTGGSASVSKNGQNVKINGATVTRVDVFNTNGLIHVIDSVILPALDIVDTALTNGNFRTLVAALNAAALAATLKGAGPFTVFAPNDAAFQNLPNGTLNDLLKPENKRQLVDILQYHVISGLYAAANLTSGQNLAMLNGMDVSVAINGQTVKVNDATVIQADVNTVNGYIHVIDKVLIPESKSGVSRLSAHSSLAVLTMIIFYLFRSIF